MTGVVISLAVAVFLVSALVGAFRLRSLLLLFIFVSPLVPSAFGYSLLGVQGVIITPTRVVNILCLASMLMAAVIGGVLRRGFPLSRIFGLFLAVRFVGIFFAPDRAGAATFVLGEAGLITALLSYLAFSVIRTDRHCRQVVNTLLVAAFVISATGWWEIWTQLNFVYTVLLPIVGAVPGGPVGIAMKGELLPRITGTLDHPLALAGFIVLLWPLAVQRLIQSHGRQRMVYWVLVGVLGFDLVASLTRIAQLAAMAEICALVYFFPRKRTTWLLGMAGVSVVVVLAVVYSGTRENPNVQSSMLVPAHWWETIAGRWEDLGASFASNPRAALIGFGFTRFDDDPRADPSAAQAARVYSYLDTDVLRTLGVTGILGFATWAGIFWIFFKRLARSGHIDREALLRSPSFAIGLGVAGALITAIPGVSIFTYTQVWPVVGVCLGAALGPLKKSRRDLRALAGNRHVEIGAAPAPLWPELRNPAAALVRSPTPDESRS